MSNSYPPSGVLFQNDRKQKDTHPDYNGNLEISREVFDDLAAQFQSGESKAVMDLAGWRKTTKANKPFLSLRSDIQWQRKKGMRQQSQGRSSAPNYDLGGDDIPF